jgi:flavodoxin I
MSKTGIFYSFSTRNSATVAEKIKSLFGKEHLETVAMDELTEEQFLKYDNYILSSPTWFDGELAGYWDEFVPALEEMDLKGKTVAIFGLGNQLEYPDNFGDAVGLLSDLLESRGAKIVGQTPTTGYTFDKSRAVRKNHFLGLLIDVENQDHLTDERLKNWVVNIRKEFNKS